MDVLVEEYLVSDRERNVLLVNYSNGLCRNEFFGV